MHAGKYESHVSHTASPYKSSAASVLMCRHDVGQQHTLCWLVVSVMHMLAPSDVHTPV